VAYHKHITIINDDFRGIRMTLQVVMSPTIIILTTMDKLQLTGQNLGRVFNFRSGHLHAATFLVLSVKLPNLQLKTRPTQLLGYLPLVIALPVTTLEVSFMLPENIYSTGVTHNDHHMTIVIYS
jgi:hypothetical protein